eukprot:scaffold1936_cov201-Alexandrium_tamarense.AAC.5
MLAIILRTNLRPQPRVQSTGYGNDVWTGSSSSSLSSRAGCGRNSRRRLVNNEDGATVNHGNDEWGEGNVRPPQGNMFLAK